MTCIIVDDDPIQQELLLNYISKTKKLILKASFTDPLEARDYLEENSADVIFLDIEMPVMSGLELLRTIKDPPQVILTTSNEKYALESYEFEITDYLLKPYSYARFIQAVDKLGFASTVLSAETKNKEEMFVRVNSMIEKVKFKDILYIQAAVDYVHIITNKRKLLVNTSMDKIMGRLPDESFMRVHRSYIVNLDEISKIDGNILVIRDEQIRISKSYKQELFDRLNIL